MKFKESRAPKPGVVRLPIFLNALKPFLKKVSLTLIYFSLRTLAVGLDFGIILRVVYFRITKV